MGHATNAQKHFANKKAETHRSISAFQEKLAATYSRGSYTTTTIGKAAFDGRVRNGIGSDHSFMATKNFLKNIACSLKTTHRDTEHFQFIELKNRISLRTRKKRSSLTTD